MYQRIKIGKQNRIGNLRSGKRLGKSFRKSVVRLRVPGLVLVCTFVFGSVCLAQTGTASGLAAPVSGFPQATFNSTGSKTATAPPKNASPSNLSSSAATPSLASPVPSSGTASPGAASQMRLSPNAAPKSTMNSLTAPGSTKPLVTPGANNSLTAPGSSKPLATSGANNSLTAPGSSKPLAVPAAVPGRGPAGVPAAKVPGAANSASVPPKAQPAPTAPKPKPVENPIIAAMIQKPIPGTSAIVGTPLSINDLLAGVSNPRQRHFRLNAYWTLTQKLGAYNIRVQHANDVNTCIQQHSPAPTGNILVLLRSAQLLAVQRVKEAELDFIQAQFRFANTVTEGQLRLTESNYFAGVSSSKEKEILTKTLSIPSDPPTSIEYNTRLEEIAKTRGASGTAKTLGITIPLQYGIVKSRLDESTQAYDNLLKLFRTANSSQELVLAALDHTTRAKLEMFNAVVEYNRMIAAYVAETVAANVRGANLMATLNQYAEEVEPVKQVRFDSTRSKNNVIPPTFAPSYSGSDPQMIGPASVSSYNNIPAPSPIAVPPSTLPSGYGAPQSNPAQSHSFSSTPTSPSYAQAPGTRLAGTPQAIGTGAPIYAVDSIINEANTNRNIPGPPFVEPSIPAGRDAPSRTPSSLPQTSPNGTGTNEDGPMPFTLLNNKFDAPNSYSSGTNLIIRGQAPTIIPPASTVATGNASSTQTTSTPPPKTTAQDSLGVTPPFPPEKQRVINELVRALFPVKAEESGAGDSPIIEIPLALRKAIERSQGNNATRLAIVEVYWKLRSKISELEVEKAIRESCQLVYSSFEKEMSRGAGASNPELAALVGSFKAAVSAADARIYQTKINIRYGQIELMQRMGQTTDTGWPVPSSYPYCGPSYRLEIDKARRNNFTLATESVLIPEKLKTIQTIGMALGPIAELFRPNISSLRTTNDGYLYLKTLENKRDSAILFIQLIESLNTSIVHYVSDFTDLPISNDDFVQSLVGPEK